MCRLVFSAFSILLCTVAASFASASPEPVRVAAIFNKIYVPQGFDSNDHIQFVGEGMFRNTCYRPAPAGVKVDESSRTISVGPVAYEYSGLCLQVMLLFNRVVDVGILKAGTWKVTQGSGTTFEELGQIEVIPTLTESPDDYLYAPISQAYFQQNGMAGSALLAGEFSSSCMTLDSVKISIQKDVIVLQPIAKMSAATTCKDGSFTFAKKVDLGFLRKGRYLLHVRSMNGNAVNTLVNVN